MRIPLCLTTLALWAAILAAPPAAGKESAAIVRNFSASDRTRDEWKLEDAFPNTPTFTEIDPAHGPSLKIPVHFPAPAGVRRGSNAAPRRLATFDRFATGKPKGQAAKAVRFSLYLPPERPPQTRVQAYLFLKNKDGMWFQGLARRQADNAPAVALETGWNDLVVDLDENAGVLRPQGHAAVWKTCYLPQMNSMGVVVTGDREWNGWVALDDVAAVMRDGKEDAAPLGFTRLSAPEKVGVYGLWEASFDVNRQLLNPYCTEEIDIIAEITPPGTSKPVVVPAFFAQDFRRVKGSDRDGEEYRDRFIPQGEGRFLLRYTPRVAGEHRWRLVARYRSPYAVGDGAQPEKCATPPAFFDVAPAAPGAPRPRGFVRVSRKDPHCFEFENGEPFYVIGHNFHSPVDTRHVDSILRPYFPNLPAPKNRGLRCYEDAFPLMAKNGLNSFEVWMSAWWLGLEWTGRWKNYHGVGQYNQENAWKLDALLAAAARHGLYAHLVIDNHGKASEFCDPEWDLSPYNADNAADGGFCRRAQHLFTGETGKMGKACYRDLYRYIAARWGWCTNIFGIETWSELDLVGRGGNFGRSEEMRAWLKEMMPWLRRWDQGKHPLTTHYCSDYRNIDREMAAEPCMDYVVGDAYHEPHELLSQMLVGTHLSLKGFDKPFMITEFGGSPHATNLPSLIGDMYCGMWLSWMTAAAGTPYFWWYDLLRQENYYAAYGAFARYAAGEDRRRPAGGPQLTCEWECVAQSAAGDEFAKLMALEEDDHAAHAAAMQQFQAGQTQRLLEFGLAAQTLTKAIAEAREARAEFAKLLAERTAKIKQWQASADEKTKAIAELEPRIKALQAEIDQAGTVVGPGDWDGLEKRIIELEPEVGQALQNAKAAKEKAKAAVGTPQEKELEEAAKRNISEYMHLHKDLYVKAFIVFMFGGRVRPETAQALVKFKQAELANLRERLAAAEQAAKEATDKAAAAPGGDAEKDKAKAELAQQAQKEQAHRDRLRERLPKAEEDVKKAEALATKAAVPETPEEAKARAESEKQAQEKRAALAAKNKEFFEAVARREAMARERELINAECQELESKAKKEREREEEFAQKIKEFEEQLADSRAAHRKYTEECNAERRRLNRTQNLVAADRLFRFYDEGRYAEGQALAAKIVRLNAQVYGDGNVFYAFVYDRQQMHHLPLRAEERLLFENIDFALANVPEGNFSAEFWDCYEGKIVGRAEAAVKDGKLQLRLPPFRTFTALKLRRK